MGAQEARVLDGFFGERMVASRLNFFLIGAPKAGTTLVHARLSQHPQVFLSPLKEPNHFATDIDPDRFSPAFKANTPDDLAAYLSRSPLPPRQIGFVRERAQYERLFADAGPEHRLVGECSTSYLWSEEAAQRVAAAHPEARILAVLRNPVERLHSHWLMARKYGFTSKGLIEAVTEDLAHPDPGWGRSELFVQAGLYAEQLERWFSVFPKEQVKVLFNASLSDDETWRDLADWLGLDGVIPEAPAERVNAAGRARWEGLNRWLTQSGGKQWLGRVVPGSLKGRAGRLWYSQSRLPGLSDSDRNALFTHFEEDLAKLEQMLGVDLAHWRP